MATITVDQADIGMILAKPLVDRRGRLLIPAGHELAAKHLQSLKMWGIDTLEVEGDGPDIPDAAEAIDPVILSAAERVTAGRFTLAGREHPLLAQVFQHCVTRRALAIQRQRAPAAAAEVTHVG